ncbi:metallophosphoesterase [Deinococcus aquiradiocola]|uniref:Metallophosphoesterase n=1 Tax=Deinococcus aquiradiocola TaxID=393059 RepID=A0A917PFF3_9DEIO|nr:metallophosphoesterase [Deinococcus aquiradiocola]GGJ73944.1 putative metallophosphoesterase [Deinococcus aquiradiocola]
MTPASPAHRFPHLSRRQVLAWGLGLGLAGTGVGAAQGYAPPELSRVQATLPGLESPLRVAVLTDLHYGPFIREAQVRAWVDLALGVRPDVTLVVGDFADVPLASGMPGPLARQLARLRAPLGVYGVWGNHDYGCFGRFDQPYSGGPRDDWQDVRERFRQELARGGLRVLTNEGLSLRPDVWLGGLDDLMWGAPDAQAALHGAPTQAAQLLMIHEPDALVPLAGTPAWRPDGLAVCGHTHGGQVRLPLLGAPVVPSAYGQRFAQGWVRGDPSGDRPGARAYVSRGLGLSGIPFRNLCPPELVLLDLHPA